MSVVQAGADMWENGPNVGNVMQMAGGAGGLASSLPQKCFTAGTQIVVGAEYDENDVFVQYVTMNIEDVQVGDLVYAYDTATGEVTQREVADVFVRESDHVNYLTFEDESGKLQTLETTDGHPFWVVTDEPDLERAASDYSDEMYHGPLDVGLNGFWVEAKDLRAGDVFLGATGELSTLVSAVRVEYEDSVTVYNFSVEGDHNYFVVAAGDVGHTCILVHNAIYDDLLNDQATTLIKPPKRSNAAIYERPGGAQQAIDDFNSLHPTNVKVHPNGTTSGVLNDGTHIDVHPSSTLGGTPTLGIQTSPNAIKIRYK